MFGNFTEEARKVMVRAKIEMNSLKHPYVGSEHLLLAILYYDNDITHRLNEMGLDYKKFKNELISIVGEGTNASNWFLYTPLLKRVIENAILDSKDNKESAVGIPHLFSSLLEEGEGIAIRIMLALDVDIDILYSEFSNREIIKKSKKHKKLLVDEFGEDITKKALNNEIDPVVGRGKEISRLIEILSRRTKNNPILIGEAGVGKTAIVEELSRLIATGEVPMNLKNKRIISLDMATLVAGTKYRGEFEDRIRKILKEVEEHDEIILFIDEIHTLVGAGGAEGAIDASNIFKPALARGKLRCIGATTTLEYKKFIEKDGALERRFQKIMVDIPSKKVVKEILMRIREIYEAYHFVNISEEMIDLIILLSDKYIYDRNEPDKTIDVLDEVCAKVSLKENKIVRSYKEKHREIKEVIKEKNEAIISHNFEQASILKEKENSLMNDINELELKLYKKKERKNVTKDDIYDVIALKTKIPVRELNSNSREKFEKICSKLKGEIVGQENAIEAAVNIIKKIMIGLKDSNKPYSLMFMGPSGVGKTELSKKIGSYLVGSDNIIRLDMSEYSSSSSISKLVGASPGYVGYEDNKNILEEVRNKPYSVLILDEIEKANISVINLFLQILDEGVIKDSSGRNIRFDNVVILMTSNIGFDDIHIGFNQNKNEAAVSKLKEYFSVPFVNRIDNVIVFNNLTKDNIYTLVEKKLDNIKKKYKEKNIKLRLSKNVIDDIVSLSNYNEFGARRLDKIIKDKVDNLIVDAIMNDNSCIDITSIDNYTVV